MAAKSYLQQIFKAHWVCSGDEKDPGSDLLIESYAV